jgi:hypothetical protein
METVGEPGARSQHMDGGRYEKGWQPETSACLLQCPQGESDVCAENGLTERLCAGERVGDAARGWARIKVYASGGFFTL